MIFMMVPFLPWWAMDHYLFHDKISAALFKDSSGLENAFFLFMVYLIFVIFTAALEKIPDKDREEKAGLLVGKFFVFIVSIEGLLILVGAIVLIITAAVKHL